MNIATATDPKTFDLDGVTYELTPARRQRIVAAIADCDRFIAKESPRDPLLRPAAVAKTLAHSIGHRAKLLAILAA